MRGTFRTLQRKKKDFGIEAVFEGMMARNSSKIMKDTKSQGALQMPSRIT